MHAYMPYTYTYMSTYTSTYVHICMHAYERACIHTPMYAEGSARQFEPAQQIPDTDIASNPGVTEAPNMRDGG